MRKRRYLYGSLMEGGEFILYIRVGLADGPLRGGVISGVGIGLGGMRWDKGETEV